MVSGIGRIRFTPGAGADVPVVAAGVAIELGTGVTVPDVVEGVPGAGAGTVEAGTSGLGITSLPLVGEVAGLGIGGAVEAGPVVVDEAGAGGVTLVVVEVPPSEGVDRGPDESSASVVGNGRKGATLDSLGAGGGVGDVETGAGAGTIGVTAGVVSGDRASAGAGIGKPLDSDRGNGGTDVVSGLEVVGRVMVEAVGLGMDVTGEGDVPVDAGSGLVCGSSASTSRAG